MFKASYKANTNAIMNKIICSAKNPTVSAVVFNKNRYYASNNCW